MSFHIGLGGMQKGVKRNIFHNLATENCVVPWKFEGSQGRTSSVK